jgi:hypothetical protein
LFLLAICFIGRCGFRGHQLGGIADKDEQRENKNNTNNVGVLKTSPKQEEKRDIIKIS